jgi:NADH-quinone oxidoreductase subunit H
MDLRVPPSPRLRRQAPAAEGAVAPSGVVSTGRRGAGTATVEEDDDV